MAAAALAGDQLATALEQQQQLVTPSCGSSLWRKPLLLLAATAFLLCTVGMGWAVVDPRTLALRPPAVVPSVATLQQPLMQPASVEGLIDIPAIHSPEVSMESMEQLADEARGAVFVAVSEQPLPELLCQTVTVAAKELAAEPQPAEAEELMEVAAAQEMEENGASIGSNLGGTTSQAEIILPVEEAAAIDDEAAAEDEEAVAVGEEADLLAALALVAIPEEAIMAAPQPPNQPPATGDPGSAGLHPAAEAVSVDAGQLQEDQVPVTMMPPTPAAPTAEWAKSDVLRLLYTAMTVMSLALAAVLRAISLQLAPAAGSAERLRLQEHRRQAMQQAAAWQMAQRCSRLRDVAGGAGPCAEKVADASAFVELVPQQQKQHVGSRPEQQQVHGEQPPQQEHVFEELQQEEGSPAAGVASAHKRSATASAAGPKGVSSSGAQLLIASLAQEAGEEVIGTAVMQGGEAGEEVIGTAVMQGGEAAPPTAHLASYEAGRGEEPKSPAVVMEVQAPAPGSSQGTSTGLIQAPAISSPADETAGGKAAGSMAADNEAAGGEPAGGAAADDEAAGGEPAGGAAADDEAAGGEPAGVAAGGGEAACSARSTSSSGSSARVAGGSPSRAYSSPRIWGFMDQLDRVASLLAGRRA